MLKDKEIVVSVIVPSFNAEKYIGEFVESILNQTYPSWELIFVDDGSSDKTVQLIQEYCKKDERIKLICRDREPKGSVTCRNIGQDAAKGKYMIHFDADDIITSICLYQRVEFMENNPSVDYASFKGESVYIDDAGKIQKTGRVWGVDTGKDLLSSFLTVQYPFSVWNNIYRASEFQNNYWDEKVLIYTDFSYIIPTILSGFKHAYANGSEADYLYRVGQTSNAMTSNFVSSEKYNSTKYLFDKTMNQLKTLPDYRQYKKKFKTYYILQFERLLIGGTIEQVDDYCLFYQKYYGRDLRIKFICTVLRKQIINGRKNNFRRQVRFYVYSLFHPTDVIKWLVRKI